MTAVFGEFLRPAAEHIAAAVGFSGELLPDAKRGVIRELDRLVATMASPNAAASWLWVRGPVVAAGPTGLSCAA